jgi:ketosteroid isomerase-like protein
MKTLVALVAFSVPFLAADAQQNSALVAVVAAEKAFAADARTGGVQQAFMKYLGDSALVFEGGEIVNGKEVWRNRNTEGASLIWYPEVAEVSAAGDLGYTTGPAQFRASKDKETPDYTGYFSSIWKKNKAGQWKVMLDIGSPAPPMDYNDSIVEYDTTSSAALHERIQLSMTLKKWKSNLSPHSITEERIRLLVLQKQDITVPGQSH